MSTSFPSALDTFLSVADNPPMNASGRTATQVVGQLQAALAAVQAVIGVTGSAVAGTVEKRLADLLAAIDSPAVVSATAPPDPEEGAIWLDTSGTPVLKVWVSGSPGAWVQIGIISVNGRSGAVVLTDSDVPATVVTESGTSRAMANGDAGRYIRFTSSSAKTATFGTGLNVVGQEFHLRNVGANNLTLTPSSTTLNAPAGGTLIVPPGGTVTVKQVASTEFDVFGQTTAA